MGIGNFHHFFSAAKKKSVKTTQKEKKILNSELSLAFDRVLLARNSSSHFLENEDSDLEDFNLVSYAQIH